MRLLPRSSTSRAQVEGQSCGQTEWPMASLAGAFMGVLGGGDSAQANRVRGNGQESWARLTATCQSGLAGWRLLGPARPLGTGAGEVWGKFHGSVWPSLAAG